MSSIYPTLYDAAGNRWNGGHERTIEHLDGGWYLVTGEIDVPAGETLVIDFLNDSQTFDRVINPYVENLRRLGVYARHNRVDNAQAVNR